MPCLNLMPAPDFHCKTANVAHILYITVLPWFSVLANANAKHIYTFLIEAS